MLALIRPALKLRQRYRRLTLWNKIAFWGSITSIIGVLFLVHGVFYPPRHISYPLRITQLIEQQTQTLRNREDVSRAPTPPENIRRVIPEWEPTEYLVLALPYHDVFSDTSITEYFMKIIENAIAVTNVLILIDEDETASLKELIENLGKRGLYESVKKKDVCNVEIFPVRLRTKWIRDFGPVFAFNKNKTLCLLDAIYIDTLQNKDEMIPIQIANYLDNPYKPIKLVRPPFRVGGGDFQTDGQGNIFCSTEALIKNGGSREDVDLIFKYYYGAKDITYLFPLPGPTIKHIDMFFKLINENTILIGEYPTDKGKEENKYNKNLQYVARWFLEKNNSIIKQKFHDKKRIIKMPMPPIKIQVKEAYRDMVRSRWDEAVARIGVSPNELDAERLYNSLADKTRIFRSTEGADAVNYIYRTYLNSTFIKGDSDELLLVPSYADCKTMEDTVKQIYKSVYPNAKIVFVNSDKIIRQYGTIHCVTLTIPKVK
jgi:agmatine/peptidylarginine deiminase